MRHRKSFNHLGRTASHRKAMLANMASSLIIHKRIETTTAKAKALRMYVEPLITKSKEDSTHSRRVVFSYLQNKEAVTELFRDVSPKIIDRQGGYTRILKTGTRLGDNADMCIIELVDYNENLLKVKADSQEKAGRRRRRGGKKKAEGVTEQVIPQAETEAETGTETTEEIQTEEAVASEAKSVDTEEVPQEDVESEEEPVKEVTEEIEAIEEVPEEKVEMPEVELKVQEEAKTEETEVEEKAEDKVDEVKAQEEGQDKEQKSSEDKE